MAEKEPVCEVRVIHENIVKDVEKKMKPNETFQRLGEIFSTLGDPTRLRILHALQQHELCVCDIASLLGMSESAISHQLRVLRNTKLVRYRKEGRIVYYSLNDRHVSGFLRQGMEHVEE
ncbi:MAG: metalloregulator ArsR/SmtB family transcription factor [bacterium]